MVEVMHITLAAAVGDTTAVVVGITAAAVAAARTMRSRKRLTWLTLKVFNQETAK
jgi:hypothetical protein